MKANIRIEFSSEKIILLRDMFDDSNPTMTITNNAEEVIEWLWNNNLLNTQRVFYIDTENRVDELLHYRGKFKDFKSGYNSEESFYKNLIESNF